MAVVTVKGSIKHKIMRVNERNMTHELCVSFPMSLDLIFVALLLRLVVKIIERFPQHTHAGFVYVSHSGGKQTSTTSHIRSLYVHNFAKL